MPIVFEEITGEVTPARPADGAAQEAPSAAPKPDLADLLRRELQLARERELRLAAD